MVDEQMNRLLRFGFIYRLASIRIVGYSLIVAWRLRLLPIPRGEAVASFPDGRRLHCRLEDATQRTMYLGLFEPTETELIGELLGPNETLLDVGAHVGWYSTIGSRRVGSTGHVIAFEPYEPNAKTLKLNLLQNECTNVRVVETALGSEAGTLTLASGTGDSGGFTALIWGSETRVEVPVVTLDEAEEDLGEVTLMKIDVEGWETNVLRGAKDTLTRTNFVLVEINPPAIAKSGSSRDEIFDLLRQAGFTHFLGVNEGGLRRLNRSGVCNVLAVKSPRPPDPTFWKEHGLSPRTARRLALLP